MTGAGPVVGRASVPVMARAVKTRPDPLARK